MTLSYLTNQTLYVGSHLGDSQLVQISPTPISSQDLSILSVPIEVKTVSANSLMSLASNKGKEKAGPQDDMDVDGEDVADYSKLGRVVEPQGSYINVLESYKNIAPIMDAISVDTDGNGQVGSISLTEYIITINIYILESNCYMQRWCKHRDCQCCEKWG